MGTDIHVEVSWKYRKRSYRYQSEIMENLSRSEHSMESPSSTGPTRTNSCDKCRCRVRPNPVCLRRLLAVAVFLLPWTLCNAAPWSLNQDTPAGNHTAVVNTRRRHHNHSHHNHKHNHHNKHSRHQHHKKNKDNEEQKRKTKDEYKKTKYADENMMNPATTTTATNLPVFVSELVAFSKDRPPMPPWAMESSMDSLLQDVDDKLDSSEKPQDHKRSLRRGKRSAGAQQAVCDSVHNWVRKDTATDIYGNSITVMDKILTNGGEQVSQWFYETKCSTTGQTTRSCRGIDTHTWDSECLNRQSFVYAMVRTAHGEEGWNWIAINTACNCALRKKSNRGNRRAPYPFVSLTETERR